MCKGQDCGLWPVVAAALIFVICSLLWFELPMFGHDDDHDHDGYHFAAISHQVGDLHYQMIRASQANSSVFTSDIERNPTLFNLVLSFGRGELSGSSIEADMRTVLQKSSAGKWSFHGPTIIY